MTVAAKVAGVELLDYDEVVARYEPVLGLEVHVELSTATKMFCGCPTAFGAEPNTQVCPVCLGLPGSLPVVNQAAVESAIRIGLALNCEIAPWCRFARKNYFYPDMPKNYQISQYDEPIAVNGYLEVPLPDGTSWRVGIERAHMEEDTGKLTHLGSDTGRIEGATTSLIDYNRSGVPLIEIVTKPIEGTGAKAPQIARAYVTALRDLLRALDVSDVRMDQGSMRCDANVSLKPIGTSEFGIRTETKNVNSLKSVEVAVRYEMQRQGAVLASGAGSSRKPGTSTKPATPVPAAPRRPPRTTGTSRSPTWSPSLPAPNLSTSCAKPSPSYRGCAAREFSSSGGSPMR
ncbi:aspartyl/glutamyl-tRNA(Asn/Gln) amidotransferase, B subunit [Mycobacterium xenopi 3993]|nr:aspartyl/glutamyl-tRNA(Asn/Gln) amidotransferase, B subunit [Mycobacterium xenopi 3993]